jgi:hypothetical protein
MDIKGKVHEVFPAQNVSDTFKKRELIIEYAENPQYPEYIKFEALQDKVSLFDGLKKGEEVELFFNLRGRPWTDKAGKTSYFNTLVIWKVNKLGASTGQPAQQQASQQQAPPPDISHAPEDDDLPF